MHGIGQSGRTLEYSKPHVELIPDYRPRGGQESFAGALIGCWANLDVYLIGPTTWKDGIPLHPPVPTWKVYAKIAGARFPIVSTTIAANDFTVTGTGLSCQIARVRGQPCEGFEVSSVATAAPDDGAGEADYGRGTVVLVGWGTEAGASSTGTSSGGAAASGTDLQGTAPSGGAGAAISAAKPASVVQVMADQDNTGDLFVSFAGNTVAAGPLAFRLKPGDTTGWIPIDDASKVFVNGSAAGQVWRAAVL